VFEYVCLQEICRGANRSKAFHDVKLVNIDSIPLSCTYYLLKIQDIDVP
jgi:hypothetical protein